MSSVEDEIEKRVAEVHDWLAENVRVITQANELVLSDFTYDDDRGKFSLSVDGEVLEDRWSFSLDNADGWVSVCPPIFGSPLGAPASFAAVELSDEIEAALGAKMREIFPRIAPLGLNRKTGVERTRFNSTVASRIIDLEGYRNTVSQIENGSLRLTIKLA
jgi:hypothetical protein